MNQFVRFFDQHPILGYFIFFVFWYLLMFYSNLPFFDDTQLALATYANKVLWMMVCAIIFLELLMPILLSKKYLLFTLGFFGLMFLLQIGYYVVVTFIIHKYWPEEEANYISKVGNLSFWQRINDPLAIFIRIPLFYMVPTLFLLFFRYTINQEKIARLNEQKQKMELNYLKHQLNPHFLFNTLNNIYSLALQKSDKTPQVVSGLADMLDYMVYQTKDRFVPIENEIKLLEDYLSLERIRYGDRVTIDFEHSKVSHFEIAPLLLLTFFENAFKHGVSQELSTGYINANLEVLNNTLFFEIRNSMPKIEHKEQEEAGVGLENVKKQLELLYNKHYSLVTKRDGNEFIVQLTLRPK